MKRTALKRTTALKRGPVPKRKTALKTKRSKARRVAVTRDPEYLKWLRDQNCCVVDNMLTRHGWPSDAAHTTVNGRSSKGDDTQCIPLCRSHHIEQHRIGWKDFEKKYEIDRSDEAGRYRFSYNMRKIRELI